MFSLTSALMSHGNVVKFGHKPSRVENVAAEKVHCKNDDALSENLESLASSHTFIRGNGNLQ